MTTRPVNRAFALSSFILAAALSLSACGGDDDSQAASQPEQSSEQQSSEQQPGGGGMPRGLPGSGMVAAVDGTTAQVRSSDSQTAVSWTASTTFTRQVDGTLSDVTEGACVVVVGEGSDGAVAASTVQVTQPVDGDCGGGFGGGPGDAPGGGGQPGGAPGERPTDLPTDRPTDRPEGGPRAGGFAIGKVTAVSDGGFTVESTAPGSDKTRAVEVSVTDSTTVTTTETASAEDVAVGVCLVSRGESDSTGALTATTIALSQAVDGECAGGFGGRPGPREDAQ